ncbi:ABC transporter permease subunit [Clostridium swellfunianum]|uniref:ABC transporter permease n=1 Tax=Clostridium swellfunianum TaxID=1367462 RepID=UPI00202E32DA|nr:ABC transporter permease subunit [Clostridium swellfunianum]MCM0647605.1 ABC transporter permease subunit [Clostridium swellfunianum]
MQVAKHKKTGLSKYKKQNRSGKATLLLMAIPPLLLLITFSYLPLFGWSYAFFDYMPGIKLNAETFAGLKYIKMAVTELQIRSVLVNTLSISLLNLLFSFFPVILAVMISELKSKRLQKLIQTTTTLPNFISWILVYAFLYAIFSNEGMLNSLVKMINPNSQGVNILANADHAWIIQALIVVWKTAGWNTIIYLAAITGIDQELYEAATVDGANRFHKIIYITLPGISETFLVLLLLQASNILSNGFDQFFVFNNPIVANKLDVLDFYVYRSGIQNAQYSFATAVGMFKSAISITILFICNFVAKKIRGTAFI